MAFPCCALGPIKVGAGQNLDDYGRAHLDMVRSGRAWNYETQGSHLGEPITAVVGWPPTGEVYARTTGGGLVLIVPGDGTDPKQLEEPAAHPLVPSWGDLRAWVGAHGWDDGVRGMVARMDALSPRQRDDARAAWNRVEGQVDLELWLRRGRWWIADRTSDLGAGLAALGLGIAAWLAWDAWSRRR